MLVGSQWSKELNDVSRCCCFYEMSILQLCVEHESVEITRKLQKEPINLNQCLEAFTTDEELGEDEKYYCSKCKKHQLARKKLQMWRLPPVLVSFVNIHIQVLVLY